MSLELKIFLSAVVVATIVFVVWVVAALRDGRRLRGMHMPSRSSRVERSPYKREVPGSSPGGTIDDTKTWPGPEARV